MSGSVTVTAALSISAPLPGDRVRATEALLDPDAARAAKAFVQRVKIRYPMIEAILFGSRARNTHRPDSDVDIAVVIEGARGNRYVAAREMAGIAFDVMMETGIMVEALPLWQDEFERPESFGNPALIYVIRREGLPL